MSPTKKEMEAHWREADAAAEVAGRPKWWPPVVEPDEPYESGVQEAKAIKFFARDVPPPNQGRTLPHANSDDWNEDDRLIEPDDQFVALGGADCEADPNWLNVWGDDEDDDSGTDLNDGARA